MARAAVAALALLSGADALRVQGAAGNCTCLNWKQTYQVILPELNYYSPGLGVKCGQANEFHFVTHKHGLSDAEVEEFYRTHASIAKEYCLGLFDVLDDNICVNVNNGRDKGQWCYVDASCSSLSGGAKVTEKVSWKRCASKQDRMLRDLSPPALAEFAGAKNLNLGLLNKMSYPLSPYRWKYVSNYWGYAMDGLVSSPPELGPGVNASSLQAYLRPQWQKKGKHIDKNMTIELKDIADSNVPTTFDTQKTSHPPHVVVQNRTVYVVMPHEKPILLCTTGCQK